MDVNIGRTLVGIHHRVAFKLTGDQPRKVLDGIWVYPLLAKVKAEACLNEVETYISRRQNTVSQYIITRSTMDLGVLLEREGVFCGKLSLYKH